MFEDLPMSAAAARTSFQSTVRDSFGSRVLETTFDPVVDAVERMAALEERLDAEILVVHRGLEELANIKGAC